ncbi:tyrosine-type recombinase/integrase [Clostridium thailandense]|uniref:tyrosine-type recombinase/integrase n=1 Tax=Clostridium thailandense TaxID=2794346 RepID=UPI003989669A
MKKANGEGSINKYKNGWRATLSLGRGDDGKLIRKQFYGKTKIEAKKKMDQYKSQYDSGMLPSNEKITFEEWFEIWLFQYKANEVADSTIEKYNSYYNNYIKNTEIGLIKLKNLKGSNLQIYYNFLSKDKKKTPELLKGLNKVISSCLRQAIKEHYILFNPCASISLPKITKKQEIAIFSLKEQKKLLTSLDGYKHRMLIILALGTGLRMGELLGLQWDDINFNENNLTVQRAVKRIASQNIINDTPRYFLGDLKTKTSARVVPIPINIVKELKLHHRIQNEAKVKCHEIYVDNNLVFANELGELLQISTIQKSYNKLLKDCGIPHKKFHALRHTYATRLFERDVPLKTVQILMGHSNIKITADVYTHVLPKEKIDAVEKLNGLFAL